MDDVTAGQGGATQPTTPPTGATPGSQQQTGQQPNGQQSQQQGQPATGDDQQLGPAGIEALRREREARADLARQLQETQAQLRHLTDKDKPEAERLTGRVTELEGVVKERETTIRDLRIELAMTTAGAKLGIVDPGLAILLMKQEGLLEFDADGKPTNTEEALKKVTKDRPFLLKPTGTANPGAGQQNGAQPGGKQDMNAAIRRAAHRGTITPGD